MRVMVYRSEKKHGIFGATFALILALSLLSCFIRPSIVFAEEKSHGAEAKKPAAAHKKVKKRARPGESKEKDAKPKKGKEAEPIEPPVIGGEAPLANKDFDSSLNKTNVIDAVLVLDASRSMQRTDPSRLRDQGAKLFIRFLAEGDRLTLIQFDKDTKILVPLTAVNNQVLAEMDKAVENVSVDGNFTDLWSPIVAAGELLQQEGRPSAEKCVILLSDGKMDPAPSTGARDDLVQRLRENDLPLYKEKKIKLYTLALSDQADRQLLAEMARITGGLHWYAANADTLHRIFSDLFLTLKKPQVMNLEGQGFDIDGNTTEATFYISRKNPEQKLTITDPQGNAFNEQDFPTGMRWYRASLFDVITLSQPVPGPWRIVGLDQPEGFATLLTDLKLQLHWPETNIKTGDRMLIQARLTNKGEGVPPGDQFKNVIFFSYKIVNAATGQLVYQGGLNDKAEEGDTQAGDGIYSRTAKFDLEGEFRALVSVTAPTFTRQQNISFNVTSGPVTIIRTEPDELNGGKVLLRALLSKEAAAMKKPEIQLIAKLNGDSRAKALPMEKYQRGDGSYDLPLHLLEKGKYELQVRFSGVDAKKKKLEGESETVEYAVEDEKTESTEEVEVVEETDPQKREMMLGLLGFLLAIVWTAASVVVITKRWGKEKGGVAVVERQRYSVPEELTARIEALRAKASKSRRAATSKELELFDLIPDVFQGIQVRRVPLDDSGKHEPAAESPAPPAEPENQAWEEPEEAGDDEIFDDDEEEEATPESA